MYEIKIFIYECIYIYLKIHYINMYQNIQNKSLNIWIFTCSDTLSKHISVYGLVLKILSEERVSIYIAIITWISYFVPEIIPFFIIFKFFLSKNKYNIINFDLTFSIQSSKFKKSVSFGSNLKIKNCEK